MHRNKFGKEYYTLLGGGIDAGETAEHALVREIKEEAEVVIRNPRLVFVEEAGDPYGTQYIYLCDYVSGEGNLHPDSEEASLNKDGQNLHTPTWRTITKLRDLPFRSEKLKQKILECLKNGFPDQPVAI